MGTGTWMWLMPIKSGIEAVWVWVLVLPAAAAAAQMKRRRTMAAGMREKLEVAAAVALLSTLPL